MYEDSSSTNKKVQTSKSVSTQRYLVMKVSIIYHMHKTEQVKMILALKKAKFQLENTAILEGLSI